MLKRARWSWIAGPTTNCGFLPQGWGIPEDPVTGSAHALVAPYWMQICSRSDVVGWQCSPRPGGMVCERVEAERIQITGSAYLLLEGTINLDAPPSSMGWMLP